MKPKGNSRTISINPKKELRRVFSNNSQPFITPFQDKLVDFLEDGRRVESRETYRKDLAILYKNKSNLNPLLYASLKSTVLPSVRLNRAVPDKESKKIINRSLFKNCYCNTEDDVYKKKLSIFHDYLTKLKKSVYPYNLMGKSNPFGTLR